MKKLFSLIETFFVNLINVISILKNNIILIYLFFEFLIVFCSLLFRFFYIILFSYKIEL